ncbi:MAG: U32 family peptidase [Desulfobacterales bacterium]|nr:U32 family peptidase [Desulfobacterales bacterium]
MNEKPETNSTPAIMAPAGSKDSFLAAVAAGADAIYCGLKSFSARMEAKNFTIEELAALTQLAQEKGVKIYVTFNSLLKPDDLNEAGKILERLEQRVKPDGIIIQDLALIQLVKQTGFSGELHLSTLANVSFPAALKLVRKNLGVNRVVIPRELNIEEIKLLAQACPPGLDLEVFVHGAICFGISGRCYWSSYLGGKSGLRGRCVQPCRRLYRQGGQTARFFSCQDLSLDVLVKVLLNIPRVRTWKIEGRKKGPHYVFYTVKAYQILRNHGNDPQKWAEAKKEALALLSQALGRRGTHYHFLPQRPQNPVNLNDQTGSGFLMGSIKGPKQKPYLIPREMLLAGDVLRIGYEDEVWHGIYRVKKYVPPKGQLYLKINARSAPPKGTPVFLVDRREPALEKMLSCLQTELIEKQKIQVGSSKFTVKMPKPYKRRTTIIEMQVYRKIAGERIKGQNGLWLSSETINGLRPIFASMVWWWLPPIIWPDQEKKIKLCLDRVLKKGARNFVLNAPWQIILFADIKGLNIWAGPFCNLSNAPAISTIKFLGFSGAIVSPELGREDYLKLPQQSPLPLGIVVSGNWPLCISRILSENIKLGIPFSSPKGEQAWVNQYESDFWVYPNWKLDIEEKKVKLQQVGYSLFVHIEEPMPRDVKMKKRPGMWNWELGLF